MSIVPKLLVFVLLSGIMYAQQTAPCSQCAAWNAPQAPLRIYGNTYYVGPHGLSSILITSSAGHVLIDGGLPESADQIAAHIRALGFRVEDVTLIVNSHVHFDHAGGIAKLQRLSGARVVASEWSARVMTRLGLAPDDPQYGVIRPIQLIARVDTFSDGETLHVGDIQLTAHLTPGHTPGGTSWTWKSCEGGRCLHIVHADSLTPVSNDSFRFSAIPETIQGFQKSFAFLRKTPCDILLTAHPDASGFWDRVEARQKSKTPDPMIDTGACRRLADDAEAKLRQRLTRESGK